MDRVGFEEEEIALPTGAGDRDGDVGMGGGAKR